MLKRKQRSFIVLASNKIHSALRPTAFLGKRRYLGREVCRIASYSQQSPTKQQSVTREAGLPYFSIGGQPVGEHAVYALLQVR